MGKLVQGHGIYIKGEYLATANKKPTKEYNTWNDMLKRCYSTKLQEKYPTYVGCEVCPEWLNFQTFANWCNKNIYSLPNEERAEIDKDILQKGNKLYSPSNCIFLPHSINSLLTKRDGARGLYPIGVDYNKHTKKFRASCRLFSKLINLGYFNTPKEAFEEYKEYKEGVILTTLQRYDGIIPKELYTKLYNVLSKYKVEIDD